MSFHKLLHTFSGDDHTVIEHCEDGIKIRFSAIGACVLVVFLLCLLSCSYTFMMVFSNPVIAIFLSVFFAWMITNIYVLLLYTLTKNPLPGSAATSSTVFSGCIRLAFIAFISLIASKPLESMLYASALDRDIEDFKIRSKKENREKILFYYQAQVNEVKRITGHGAYQQQFALAKEHQKFLAIKKMEQLVNASPYYLQRIKFLGKKYPSSWLVTFLCLCVFICPVYTKYKMRHSDYSLMKGGIETKMVMEEYSLFKEQYSHIFDKVYNRQVSYSECYEDAPFNTVRKKDQRKFHTEEYFLSELYDA